MKDVFFDEYEDETLTEDETSPMVEPIEPIPPVEPVAPAPVAPDADATSSTCFSSKNRRA